MALAVTFMSVAAVIGRQEFVADRFDCPEPAEA